MGDCTAFADQIGALKNKVAEHDEFISKVEAKFREINAKFCLLDEKVELLGRTESTANLKKSMYTFLFFRGLQNRGLWTIFLPKKIEKSSVFRLVHAKSSIL